MRKRAKREKKLNNEGFTLIEMVVTFALLALFMVAVTRVISYTVMLYHTTQASANGLEIAGILSNKVIDVVEDGVEVEITDANGKCRTGSGYIAGSGIQVTDENGNKMIVLRKSLDGSGYGYLDLKYENTIMGVDGKTVIREGVWKYDPKVYMGFTISDLSFEKGLEGYPDDVVKMSLTLHNDKYGNHNYHSEYYMKWKRIKEEPDASE